eukprot:50619_1
MFIIKRFLGLKSTIVMSSVEEISEPKLEFIVSHQIREQEKEMQSTVNIPTVIQQMIRLYIQCISRKIEKILSSKKFEIKIIQPSAWKSEQYEYIEYEFGKINFSNKLSIGVFHPMQHRVKKLQNYKSFWGIFIKKNKIFIKRR